MNRPLRAKKFQIQFQRLPGLGVYLRGYLDGSVLAVTVRFLGNAIGKPNRDTGKSRRSLICLKIRPLQTLVPRVNRWIVAGVWRCEKLQSVYTAQFD